MQQKLNILLTNDDGYLSPGIRALHDALVAKHNVTVSAPASEQSGIGHAFTFNKPLSYFAIPAQQNMNGWAVTGTPSDCVKFAISHLLPQMPDIVVSGINIGENSGISSFYSGTVAAAREGAFWRLPSMAFSVCTSGEPFLKEYCAMAVDILDSIMQNGPKNNGKVVFYNVNFPDCAPTQCKGVRATRQSLAYFDDKYKRVDGNGSGDGFIVYGDKVDVEPHDSFDSRAIMNQYVAVTPLCFDATAEWALSELSTLDKIIPFQQ